ncbi:TatD family hydrolase [Magnetococcales bacterium HHB-1]
MYIDSHCHLDFPDFSEDLEQVFKRAKNADVRRLNLIGVRLNQVDQLHKLCQTHSHCSMTVGVHPHYAEAPVDVEDLIHAANYPYVVAIGETGLDYYYENSQRINQMESFRRHIQAAIALNLPVVVHTRDAEEDTRTILDEENILQCGGVLHCFTGSESMARWALDRGMYISFSGIVTFKSAQDLRDIARFIPDDRLLIETDSPYLAPVPHRGKRNEPSFVVEVAKTLAKVRETTPDTIGRMTSENFHRLFFQHREEIAADTLAYTIGDALYLNVTRGCTLRCQFCPKWTTPIVHHYDLTLNRNPTAEELIEAMGDFQNHSEIVFCGYGEPTLRLEEILTVAKEVKKAGLRVRLNTDGLANRVYQRDVTQEMAGLIDAVSVSLNAHKESIYNRHCKPTLRGAYQDMLDFLRAAKAQGIEVTATAIEGLDGVDIKACRDLAENQLGVLFRVRTLNRLG